MRLERAGELLQLQIELGGGYNRNAARVIPAEVQRGHGQEAVDRLILGLDLERMFGLKPSTQFYF